MLQVWNWCCYFLWQTQPTRNIDTCNYDATSLSLSVLLLCLLDFQIMGDKTKGKLVKLSESTGFSCFQHLSVTSSAASQSDCGYIWRQLHHVAIIILSHFKGSPWKKLLFFPPFPRQQWQSWGNLVKWQRNLLHNAFSSCSWKTMSINMAFVKFNV